MSFLESRFGISRAGSTVRTEVLAGVTTFLTLVMMPLTYSIANGLIWGITSCVALKLTTGRVREVGVTLWVLAGLFIVSVAFDLT